MSAKDRNSGIPGSGWTHWPGLTQGWCRECELLFVPRSPPHSSMGQLRGLSQGEETCHKSATWRKTSRQQQEACKLDLEKDFPLRLGPHLTSLGSPQPHHTQVPLTFLLPDLLELHQLGSPGKFCGTPPPG